MQAVIRSGRGERRRRIVGGVSGGTEPPATGHRVRAVLHETSTAEGEISAIGEDVQVEEIFAGAVPFILMLGVALAIIIAFPRLNTWLPSLM